MALRCNKAHFYIRHNLRATKLSTSKVPPVIHSRNKFGAITIMHRVIQKFNSDINSQ
jgi:hypothetical protein